MEVETLNSWAKWLEDIAKAAVVAIPVVVFGHYGLLFKFVNSGVLTIGAYVTLVIAKQN
ncbi:hypothetical protein [Pasteurella oralis]|uniref:hypothetical protein n=1 Tax=Pasteurella oralis TaxID=1071947 RepID=UPI001FEC0833|nr:hypothetical protein [Pasteurella oralis]